MSGEPLTRRERRERQAIDIETEGREMPSPCTACREARSSDERPRPRCVVDVRCDVSVTWTEWERLRSQRRKLKRQLDEAEEKVTEAMTRVHRLRKQLRVAEDREEKEISKEFVALQKLPSESAGAGPRQENRNLICPTFTISGLLLGRSVGAKLTSRPRRSTSTRNSM
ncbi:hypothetical protein LTR91_024611 [Friedmanniomyces endolithicus]|uniref:Uncharacterized protein n=1 Tax=Friedmanniomyces endolithicus TaxID=329885 RepID=A0AAN6JXB0_9PEZI|nr:hypothetical protein LTR91_024611 [Friedmanniomyces endolithicus]